MALADGGATKRRSQSGGLGLEVLDFGKEVILVEKDPVCGMDVDKQKAAGHSEHHGKTYYFCSAACKQKFDKEPAKYAGR